MHVTQRFSHANQVLRAAVTLYVIRSLPVLPFALVRLVVPVRIEELNGQIAIECREVGIHGDLADVGAVQRKNPHRSRWMFRLLMVTSPLPITLAVPAVLFASRASGVMNVS